MFYCTAAYRQCIAITFYFFAFTFLLFYVFLLFYGLIHEIKMDGWID